MNYEKYALDIRQVDFSDFDKNVWKCPKNNPPSPTSYQDVIIVKQKHGLDVECICAGWYPTNNYSEGEFRQNNRLIDISDIYLWRDLRFIKVGEYLK